MDLAKQHQINEGGEEGEDGNGVAVKSAFPEELRRRYEVFLTLPPGEKLLPMRGVTSAHLGSLVKLKVRTSHFLVVSMASILSAPQHINTAAKGSATVFIRSGVTCISPALQGG